MTTYRQNITTIVTRRIILLGLMILLCLNTRAEIWIGGNVYGGGDQGKVGRNTKVIVLSGNLGTDNINDPGGSVFGGARMADVGGNAYVHIDGEHATNYIVANRVYGGNDIAGTIEGNSTRLPDEIKDNENGVDGSWNAVVHLSTKTIKEGEEGNEVIKPDPSAKSVYIGQLFGGGNGEYTYTSETDEQTQETTYYIKDSNNNILAENKTGFTKPNIQKTYVDIHGGSIVYAFAGGNNATVTEKAVIHVDNPSKVVNHIYDTDMTDPETQPDGELLTKKRFKAMGINTGFSKPSSDEFQIGRLFGGNNRAEMSIRPTWSLESGKVRNVYSGGNQGPMTHTEGLLLEIKESSTIVIDNLYGGCRMADVDPLISGTIEGKDAVHAAPTDIQLSDKDDQGMPLYRFPAGLAARVLVRGGDINNVYGGNDVRGRVYGGNAIGIYTSIRGDVYGGGNGSYPYTDNADLIGNDVFGDFYYNPDDVLNANYTTEQISTLDQDLKSVTALNAIRPDAEQVSIRLVGKADKNTIIGGSVYVGGNSATIVTDKENPKVELKIGSYVIADKVFLGNNGENMIDQDYLKLYAGYVDPTTDELTNENTEGAAKFSTIDLTDKDAFAAYMDGAAMSLIPSLVFDDKNNGDPDDYLNYSTKIGSFYCGGNVGSMTYAGTNTMNFNRSVIIYNKLVGGCNNANVDASPYNAYYEGGILGHKDTDPSKDERTSYTVTTVEGENQKTSIKDRLVMNFYETKIMPMRWDDTFKEITQGTLTAGKTYYTSDLRSSAFIATGTEKPYNSDPESPNKTHYYELETPGKNLVWNTVRWDDDDTDDRFIATGITPGDGEKDEDRRLMDGNVYGGCYESGHVNGNVVINLNNDLFDRKEIFAQTTEDEEGNVTITGTRNSGVIYDEQTNDVNAVAMTVFGGGYGEGTEIWGSTTVNLNRGYTLQIFGGGYSGAVGKRLDKNNDGIPDLDDQNKRKYTYNADYSTTVRLNGATTLLSEDEYDADAHIAEAGFLYGAGNKGDVAGNSYVYLGNGIIYDVFGGASNADILGHTEVYIGGKANGDNATIYGFPWVKDIVYGGNDFGGKVKGEGDFTSQVTSFASGKVYSADLLKASAYVEYIQGRIDTIFGGSYGNYNYHDKEFYVDEHEIDMPYLKNSFVNIRPEANDYNQVLAVFGGSTGYKGNRNGDKAQDHSYVLIDIPQNVENFRYTEIYGAGSYSGIGMRTPILPIAKVNPPENPGDNPSQEAQAAYEAANTQYQAYQNHLKQLDESSAVVDLVRGKVGAAYGGSYNEGVTRRTVVNVPAESTIDIGSIFGGAYGNVTLSPCDVYEANVNYHSDKAWLTCNPRRLSYNNVDSVGDRRLKGAIYGGNNNRRRTLYSKINIDVPVNQHNHVIYEKDGKILETKGYVYGAGLGENTWAEYTEVNLNDGAWVYEVYGGGENGLMINSQSIQKYINELASVQGLDITKAADLKQWQESWSIGGGLDGFKENNDGIIDEFKDKATLSASTFYTTNDYTNLNNPLVTPRSEFGDKRFNANVIINKGAYVGNYAYGGGLGSSDRPQSGDIYGTTYIALLGGEVKKDIYAAGTTGGVYDEFGVMAKSTTNPNGFTASANAYIEGGTARNVYGGGWEGNVGKHTKLVQNNTVEINAGITDDIQNDIPGETNVVIGIRPELASNIEDYSYYKGVPAIQRNAYAGGEGGSVIGTANITVNNGYIGYVHLTSEQEQDSYGSIKTTTGLEDRYEAKINDETNWQNDVWYGSKSLEDCGNVFGSGYDDMSSVDISNVTLYGGIIRNSVFGGGEIATVGRGTSGSSDAVVNVYKAGETHIYMYNGHVLRNVFGGGKGYNNLGYGGKNKLHTDGFVFGQTEVNIHGGEIGTANGVALGDGNVFGGGDRGYVYSAYEYTETQEDPETHKEKTLVKVGRGKKDGARYDNNSEGYYYKHNGSEFVIDNGKKVMTEDCKVLIEPWLQIKPGESNITIGSNSYKEGDYVPTSDLNTLPKKTPKTNDTPAAWPEIWNKVDVGSIDNERGVIIHNAVFAGGNISAGSTMNANTRTVYGNATASINDVYHRDFITIGTGHTGGLYGDGNLTLVDGYRELNITNYGTDYYNMSDEREISIGTYNQLPPREQAYYEVRYKCIAECVDKEGTHYKPASEGSKASTITFEEMLVLFLKYEIPEGAQTGTYVSLKQGDDDILEYKNGNWVPNDDYWEQNGVCSIYAGRIMNTIQRADFCGVFGSRMVMKGAQDRVPETVDYTNYTINRVREVSLNKKTSGSTTHGNYFGIYSIVNYLGALTSDVDFGDASTNTTTRGDVRVTDNKNYQTSIKIDNTDYAYLNANATYSNWKRVHYRDNSRNNGNSHNQVALASGVYLELTTELSTGTEVKQKDWGLITGVVELDLINVSLGIGGGFVYAKNQHGKRHPNTNQHPPLTSLNQGAVSKDDFGYDTSVQEDHWEASGNFVHSSQTIVDDCYNIGGKYYGNDAVLAHYWFIKGQVYIYDQYISAYTGSPNAYSETVDIPLSISSASHSEMKLVDIQPNKYALYASVGNDNNKTKLKPEQKLIVNDVTYYLNDPISYWDWSLLNASERALFVDDTYVNCVDVKIDNDNNLYKAGTYVMSKDELATFKTSTHQYKTESGETVRDGNGNTATTDYIFRSSNNVSHDRGYILTYDVNNPDGWNKWYTPEAITTTGQKISTATYNDEHTIQSNYIDGPTYHASKAGLYGRRLYKLGDIIPQADYLTYKNAYNNNLTENERVNYAEPDVFEPAYITTEYVEVDVNDETLHLQKGAKLAKTEYTTEDDDDWPAALKDKVKAAYICTSTIKISDTEYVVVNELLTQDDINELISHVNAQITALPGNLSENQTVESLTDAQKTALGKNGINTLTALLSAKEEISTNIVPAYYCTSTDKDGVYYGGDYYNKGTNYRAMDVWTSMSSVDRKNFEFNYDALDILVDSTYGGSTERKYQYDGKGFDDEDDASTNPAGYSLKRPLDYTATYTGSSDLKYIYKKGDNGAIQEVTIKEGDELAPEAFERIPNEKRNYTQFIADKDVYIVNTAFMYGNTPYAIGQTITGDQYSTMGEEYQDYVTHLEFDENDKGIYYFCRQDYVIGHYSNDITYYYEDDDEEEDDDEDDNVEGTSVVAVKRGTGDRVDQTDGDDEISVGETVPAGYVISQATYNNLINKQLEFNITSVAPKEYSTFYVSRNSDINDLSKDKIITVIYRYDYEETTDEAGTNIVAVSERHVVNIHLQFKSGIPYVPDITAPGIVLPGEVVALKEPNVTPGAYDIIGSGWELFEEPRYAENHTNGIDYTPHEDELYWYENGYYVAYYAKTYLGKHYSNHVPISVANYHDLKQVMDDKQYHLHVDHPRVKRESKIYINDYSSSSQNGLDLFKDFYDLSLVNLTYNQGVPVAINDEQSKLNGHVPMNSHVKGGDNLEFILRTDLDHSGSSWTPIGDNSQCFKGNLHGDGYTISGLDHSLFGKLCGEVYNLGVTGTFTSSGVADSGENGYVESCWIDTEGTPDGSIYAVFGLGTDVNDYGRRQLVNSYYPDTLNYNTVPENENDKRGIATPMSKQSFYNGEVTYNLNSFYLNKRYYDGKQLTSGADYKYIDTNNKTEGYKFSVGHYPPLSDLSEYAEFSNLGYVEKRYADGDFRYAEGYIPSSADPRYIEYTVQETGENDQPVNVQKSEFVPLWPNDYLFFGQDLTYGYDIERAHQEIPSNYDIANRVMRAPAYYGSKNMSVVHFNADAYLTAKSSDGKHTIYPGMTAIDLAGHGDVTGNKADYKQGLVDGKFFAPLLDYTDLTSIVNHDETQNLLVYAPGDNHSATQSVLTTYFAEPIYVEDNTSYRRVEQAVTNTIHGHLVNYNLTANNDHLLVDKQDFNAPIGYEFVKKSNDHIGSRMWYQRVPGLYMETSNSGWETVSLPFTAELVTTQQKGEITHFYEGNTVGHEYWLRKLDQVESNKDPNDDTKTIYTGIFKSLESGTNTKTVSNTFLWDYYYSKNNQDDANGDDYQEYYKNKNRDYNGYPYYAAGTPYLIGWPGSRYYEFDLSGQFVPKNTAADTPARLDPQVITFASETGISIDVTDDEYLNAASKVTYDGYAYTFVPTYQTKALTDDYLMNATGNKFEQQATATTVPFRPYITVAASVNGAQRRMGTRASELLIGYNGESNQLDETAANRSLFIYSENMSICIESTLDYPADVAIYNVAGKQLKQFTIQPATKVSVPVNSRGVYIVNHQKIAVTK